MNARPGTVVKLIQYSDVGVVSLRDFAPAT